MVFLLEPLNLGVRLNVTKDLNALVLANELIELLHEILSLALINGDCLLEAILEDLLGQLISVFKFGCNLFKH